MKQIELLEQKLKMMLDNIERIKEYKRSYEKVDYKPYKANVVGELKHRSVTLIQKITLVSKINTYEIWTK